MIIDTRYHCASLVAVFLALGLGIVIGSLLVGDKITESIVGEREKLVERLEEDYANIKEDVRLAREEYSALEKELELYKDYARETIPAIIGGRLNGKRILLIKEETKTIPDCFEENLRLSGAEFSVLETEKGGVTPVLTEVYSFANGSLNGGKEDIDAVIMFDLRDSPIVLPGEISGFNERFYLGAVALIPEQVALILSIAGRRG